MDHIPFQQIETVTLSQFGDGFLIINLVPEPTPKGPLAKESVIISTGRKSELITVLTEEYRNCMRTDLKLMFQDTMKVTTYRKKGMFSKPKPFEHTLQFQENASLRQNDRFGQELKIAIMEEQVLNKKDPAFNPELHTISVSPCLGSGAQIQLNDEI